ncbi:MAG: aminomethyl-transferring glycine dehydrogenase subunit GcvPB, partial [Nitrososphaerales archaeon]
KVVTVPSDRRGMVDIEKLRTIVSEKTAGIMLTVPNTLGLFEADILLISKLVHDAGGLLYYDGANMNALLGRVRPGDMGFDIVHLNVHKTFSTPHGGGGPGAGPVGVKEHLVPYLPTPVLEKEGQNFTLRYDLPKSIGRVKSFYGNIGVLMRVYVYLLLIGARRAKEVFRSCGACFKLLVQQAGPELFSNFT